MKRKSQIPLFCLVLSALVWTGPAWAEDADERITGRVETALLLSPVLSGRSIDVSVEDGNVVLSGNIGSNLERDLALAVAASMPGVNEVEESLDLQQGEANTEAAQNAQLRQSSFNEWQQAHIAAQLRQDFAESPVLDGENITFVLDGDHLTLEGSVETELERMVATQLSQRLEAVAVVDNRLEVEEEPTATEPVEMPAGTED